jgi:hypothetical protein
LRLSRAKVDAHAASWAAEAERQELSVDDYCYWTECEA